MSTDFPSKSFSFTLGNFFDWPIENPVLKKDIKQIKSKFFIVLFLGFDDIQSTIKPKLSEP